MVISRLIAIHAVALAASMSAAHAGPCSPKIEQMQTRIDTRLKARAGDSSPSLSSAAL
jgi:hypothetical protein